MPYDREAAAAYAHRWAYKRNPRYMSLDGIGGDCTNFISQCLYAGGAPMYYLRDFGWYYVAPDDRAPAWTGVEFLYNFLMGGFEAGPFAHETDSLAALETGDIIQLAFSARRYAHSLLVVQPGATPEALLIAAHSDDSDNRPLSTYAAVSRRYLRIDVRKIPRGTTGGK